MTSGRRGSRLGGVIPVAPTAFADDGALDLESQRHMTDFLIDARSDAICILANWSEQFALNDAERDAITDAVIGHAAGRVPVIVTTHPDRGPGRADERARRLDPLILRWATGGTASGHGGR